jgi:flagellar biosynthetic protein FlhB
MAEDSDLERTEPASARRLDQAREKGNVPRSRELASLAVLLMSAAVIAFLGTFMYQGLFRVMQNGMSFGPADVASTSMMGRDLFQAGMDALILYLPLALGVVIAAVAANLMISGWVFSPKAFDADFSKLNVFSGISRMFSRQSLVELFKALLKGGLIAGVAGWMIWRQREGILNLSLEPLADAVGNFAAITLATFLAAAVAYALIVAVDVPFQLWNYHHGLRMTKEEIRQEAKETEGDPQIKARIRSLQREAARRRMMQAVPKADVVVTNPLHFAVALQYREGAMAAPVVIAKGTQLVAERIKQLARENRVAVVEAPPLARALHRHVEVGETIPATLFTAVAQVLAYVYQLRGEARPVLPADWQVPAEWDPASGTEPS